MIKGTIREVSLCMIADRLIIDVMVAIPGLSASSQAPNPAYNTQHFVYNEAKHVYTCLAGEQLTTNGTWHKVKYGSAFQQFSTPAYITCKVRQECTTSKVNGRIIRFRKENPLVKANRSRVDAHPSIYKRRQAIVEHPYGTLKRQWGLTKKGKKQGQCRCRTNAYSL